MTRRFSKCIRTQFSDKVLWYFKPNNVKRQAIVLSVDKGGLKMIDFTILDKSLKTAWVERFYEADGGKWCSVFSFFLPLNTGVDLSSNVPLTHAI